MNEYRRENNSYTFFIFSGFQGVKEHRHFLFIPFFILFVLIIFCNSVIIYLIKSAPSLHSPMYFLIAAIAAVDMTVPVTFVPKMLFNFLCDWNEISLLGCLIQMYFVHFVASFESAILLIMAIDRYVAICNPLRYNDYINSSSFLIAFIAAVLRSFILIFLIVLMAGSLSYCLSNVIEHCYCEHMALISLACDNTSKNNIMGLVAMSLLIGFDLLLILISYIKIFSVVVRSACGVQRQKAIHTCSTHLIVILMTYLSAFCSLIAYRMKHSISSDVHVLIGVLYLLLPCCCNPIIYGLRTKEIRDQIMKKISNMAS
ncbi:olfactory receptor 52K1-like [Polypterus senegalus]|uniref:olfactory receptor 52K1-like n=1 Tax=Polypterus senegalus TaxID=55291 RepID=UPI001964016E|nr:olfactory receptor 52K1-like [Polypterus senegalus]